MIRLEQYNEKQTEMYTLCSAGKSVSKAAISASPSILEAMSSVLEAINSMLESEETKNEAHIIAALQTFFSSFYSFVPLLSLEYESIFN